LLLATGDTLIAKLPDTSAVREGDEVPVGWNANQMRVFGLGNNPDRVDVKP
jgi:hypothetical protein